jgi:hypothetical protein
MQQKKLYFFTACMRLVYELEEATPQYYLYKETEKTSIFASVYVGHLTTAMCCCNEVCALVPLLIISA